MANAFADVQWGWLITEAVICFCLLRYFHIRNKLRPSFRLSSLAIVVLSGIAGILFFISVHSPTGLEVATGILFGGLMDFIADILLMRWSPNRHN